MEIDQSNEHGQLDVEQLLAFESVIGVALPEDLWSFLIAHNGGRPNPSTFYFLGESAAFFRLHHTYGLHNGPVYRRLTWAKEIFTGRLSSDLLPFADDRGGNQICIGIHGARFGQVYFWDHETEKGNETLLAKSFAEFLLQLRSQA